MKLLRKLYNWVLSLTESKHSNWALFLLAFAESSFFPIPPDVLLITLSVGKPTKSFFYATISTIGSVLGGIFGYAIGYGIWEVIKGFFFRYVFSEVLFLKVQGLYQHNAFLAVFTAGFTPIPYKVFTIAGGVCHIGLTVFILASVLSRAARFFMVAGLIWKFGKKINNFIDKYFNLLTIIFTILLVGGFLILKKVF
ncbi:MAG: YqaA family protein [Elusimicrobiota bacterium]